MTGDRARRAWHPEIPGPGARLRLGPEESHHLLRVLRLRPGHALSLFDGRGREWEAALDEVYGDAAVVIVGAERTDAVEPALDVTLAQGLCRPERLEWALQKGTELGVASFVLVASARVEGAAGRSLRLERWRRIVLEAAKQSGRRRIPSVEGPVTPADLDPSGGLAVVLHPGPASPGLADLLASRSPGPTRIAVGPEGGFEDGEIAALVARGWEAAGLGPRILRSETAGPIACALVLAAWGDLGHPVDARGPGS